MWGALIGAGISLIGGALQGNEDRKAARRENEAKQAANLQNTLEIAQEIGSLNVQQGMLRRNAAAQRSTAQRVALLGSGSATASAASAGVRGASVDAVLQDINRELGWAHTELELEQEGQVYNLRNRIRQVTQSGIANLYGYNPVQSSGDVMRNAAVGAGLNFASQYANQYFQFGGTSTNTSPSLGTGATAADYTGTAFSTWSANQ